MCCVIPPASVSTTADWRIASSSVVLPWSTWPMIVTTGGRGARSSSASSKTSGSSSSSAACLIVISRLELGPDQLDLLVGERLRDLDHLAEAHHDLDQLRGRNAERLREVADGDARRDGRRTGRRRDLLLLALRHRVGAAAVVARVGTVGPALDHDPALTPGRSLAGPNRTVWLVRFVGHQRSV